MRRTVVVSVVAVLALAVGGAAVLLSGSGPGTATGPAEARSDTVLSGPAAMPGIAPDRSSGPETASDGATAAVPGPPAPGGVPIGGVARALVRTAQLTMDVDDPAESARRVRTAAAGAGASVVEEQSGDGGAWLVLRVPAAALDRLVDDIGAAGRVTGRTSQVLDATEQVVDLDARVASQQASVARVRTLLAQARSIGDVIAVEAELARREADLDSLTSRLAALRDQVALSTLTVDLRGPDAPPPGDEVPLGFLGGLATGWDGLRTLGAGVAAVIGFALPFVPVVAVLAALAWWARRLVAARGRGMPAVSGGPGPAGPPTT